MQNTLDNNRWSKSSNDNTQDESMNARPQKEEEQLGETNDCQKYLNYKISLVEKGGILKYDTEKDDLHKRGNTKFGVALLTTT